MDLKSPGYLAAVPLAGALILIATSIASALAR